MSDKIIYVMDPLCGWSYGNSSNFVEFYNEYKNEYDFEILSGGIRIDNEVTYGGKDMLEYVKMKGRRISMLSGVEFSDIYYENLATNPNYSYDSVPSCRAISTVKLMNSDYAIDFADQLQRAQFVDGKNNNDENVLAEIAHQLGLNKNNFLNLYRSEESLKAMYNDFRHVREIGVDSFPSIYLKNNDEIIILGKGYMTVEEMIKSVAFCFKKLDDI